MEEETGAEEEVQVIQDNTSSNVLQINERVTERNINDESSIERPSSYPPESGRSPETATSISSRESIHMHIFTTDNSSVFSKKSLARKSI